MSNESTRFQPGQSGNPAGRPAGLRRLLVERYGDDAAKLIDKVVAIAFSDKADTPDKTRLEALKLLLAYHSGQPLKSMELAGPNGEKLGPITFVIQGREKAQPAA